MKLKQVIYPVILSTISVSSFANLAQITILKGTVTYLSVGMREAKTASLNQWLPKDTSLLTKDKSFVKLKYKNGTEVSLGPESKVLIDHQDDKNQEVIGLMLGKLKASVRNIQKDETTKMIIKTKSAALGVRGTEFQTTYSPETKITSLLTFEGAVAMAKIDPEKRAVEDTNKIEATLKDKSVLVKVGEYSGTSATVNTITEPVKIAPEQFTKLKLNQTLGATEEKIDQKVFEKELIASQKEYVEANRKEENSKVDEKSGAETSALRAGGYFDEKTGLYLPPPKTAEFDEKLKIFKTTEAMGKVDDQGQFTPPEGIKLDPVQGIVIEEKIASLDTLKYAQELSDVIVKQVETPIIKRKKDLNLKDEDIYNKYYKKD